MTLRILHVFAPSLKNRFGGQSVWWKAIFTNWDSPNVVHFVLDYDKKILVNAQKAFEFEYPSVQKGISRWGRILWIVNLFKYLIQYKEEYDIVHMHVLWWGSLFVAPWAKRNNIPALYESILLGSDTPGGIIKERFGRVKIYFLRFYKAILAISDFLAEDYRKFGFSSEQVFTLTNCVDTKLFFPPASTQKKIQLRQEMDFPIDATILVFVGSVVERKGVDLLVQAFIKASVHYPDLYLLVVGPNNKYENPSLSEVFVNKLYSQIQQNGLKQRVLFTGLVQNPQRLAKIYRASDIFVFPSRNEGLGNVILEAMASGLPVIVSKLPVLEKIIVHNETGVFVPVGTVDPVRDAILMLVENSSRAGHIGQKAASFVRNFYNFSEWQAQLVEFYNRLLNNKTLIKPMP